MNSPNQCPKCGAQLPGDAPESHCPACLISGALPTNFETVEQLLAEAYQRRADEIAYVEEPGTTQLILNDI